MAPVPALAGGGFEMGEAWVQARRPDSGVRFLALQELWGQESDGCVATVKLLEPVRDHFQSTLIAVPGDLEALDRSAELIHAAGFSRDQMRTVVDPVVAAGELMNHLYLEMWLALDEDTEALYSYTAELFSDTERLEDTLHRAYVLRLAHLPTGSFEPLLVNNPRLAAFLLAPPGDAQSESSEPDAAFVVGMTSWELFRQLLRPTRKPLSDETVEVLAECLDERLSDEIDALRRQTERLAEKIATPADHVKLIDEVERFIDYTSPMISPPCCGSVLMPGNACWSRCSATERPGRPPSPRRTARLLAAWSGR